MNNSDQLYINHEVRLQMLEEIAKETKETLKEVKQEIHSNFKWIIAIILGSVLLPVILHGAKLL